jgi:pilus assembly protein CpaE
LAFACAGSASVVLAELGVAVPELALDLDLAPRHSLAELIGASERMDASMIRNTVVAHAAGVDVLAYLPDTPTAEPLPAAAIRDFQILLRNLYNWTILDAGHPRAGSNDDLIRHADHIVLVARLDPPSLRLTRKYFQSLVTGGVPADQIAVVANRYGQPGLVPWRKAEEALSTTIRAWLPDDPKSVNRCLVEGQPLVQIAKRSPLAVEFSKLAAELVAKSVVS